MLHNKQYKRLLPIIILVHNVILICVVLQGSILGRKGLHHVCECRLRLNELIEQSKQVSNKPKLIKSISSYDIDAKPYKTQPLKEHI